MKHADLSLLPEYLKSRRWFAGKAWPIKTVTVVDYATIKVESREFTLAVVEVLYELGKPERYLLCVKVDKNGRLFDALEEDELARAVLALIRNGANVPSGGGSLKGERLDSDEVWSAVSATPPVKRLANEQSNTSVVFDEKIILKLIRRLEHGVHPELEMGRFLARKKFAFAPRLLGALHIVGTADSTIATAHEFIPCESDGWDWLVARFRASPAPSADTLGALKLLGERVGQLHVCLASEPNEPAFAPEPIGNEDLDRWSSSIIGELGVTLADATRLVPQLGEVQSNLTARARKLAKLTPSGQKTRVHGDLHLGQVLRAKADWMIFDFEGEPGRSFLQRREKQSPLKDVAGMLRSFSYAEAAAATSGQAEPARAAFLDGYWKATRGASFLPADEETTRGLLDALELEKALYELRYEVNHRPDWVRIPARTLLAEAR